jgi:uncharacterized protein DUF4082/PEP-CTERM motif-containing protein
MRTSFAFFRFAGIVLALALFAGINAMADTMAFSVPCPSTCISGPAGTSGDPVNLAIAFTVGGSNISVDALGFYDTTGSTETETVGLYDSSKTLLTSLVVTGSATGYVFGNLATPVMLTAGDNYVVNDFTGENGWLYSNPKVPVAASQISVSGTPVLYLYDSSFAYPTQKSPEFGYYGPNFEIAGATSPAVPEPSSVFLLGGCLLGVIAFRRKKHVV